MNNMTSFFETGFRCFFKYCARFLSFQTLSANGSGEMKLKVETDLATIVTHFRDLGIPTWSKYCSKEPTYFPRMYFQRNTLTRKVLFKNDTTAV